MPRHLAIGEAPRTTRPYRSTDIFLWNTVPSQNEPWNAGANSSFDGLNPRIGKPPAPMIFGNTPFLSAHLVGDTAWVDVIFIPRGITGEDEDGQIFEEWSAKLPASIRRIQLLAADLDGGSPIGFWTKMGFEVDGADFPEQFSDLHGQMGGNRRSRHSDRRTSKLRTVAGLINGRASTRPLNGSASHACGNGWIEMRG